MQSPLIQLKPPRVDLDEEFFYLMQEYFSDEKLIVTNMQCYYDMNNTFATLENCKIFRKKLLRMNKEGQSCLLDVTDNPIDLPEKLLGWSGFIKVNQVNKEGHLIYFFHTSRNDYWRHVLIAVLQITVSPKYCLKFINCRYPLYMHNIDIMNILKQQNFYDTFSDEVDNMLEVFLRLDLSHLERYRKSDNSSQFQRNMISNGQRVCFQCGSVLFNSFDDESGYMKKKCPNCSKRTQLEMYRSQPFQPPFNGQSGLPLQYGYGYNTFNSNIDGRMMNNPNYNVNYYPNPVSPMLSIPFSGSGNFANRNVLVNEGHRTPEKKDYQEPRKVCSYWLKGQCMYGSNCRNLHSQPLNVQDQTSPMDKIEEEILSIHSEEDMTDKKSRSSDKFSPESVHSIDDKKGESHDIKDNSVNSDVDGEDVDGEDADVEEAAYGQCESHDSVDNLGLPCEIIRMREDDEDYSKRTTRSLPDFQFKSCRANLSDCSYSTLEYDHRNETIDEEQNEVFAGQDDRSSPIESNQDDAVRNFNQAIKDNRRYVESEEYSVALWDFVDIVCTAFPQWLGQLRLPNLKQMDHTTDNDEPGKDWKASSSQLPTKEHDQNENSTDLISPLSEGGESDTNNKAAEEDNEMSNQDNSTVPFDKFSSELIEKIITTRNFEPLDTPEKIMDVLDISPEHLPIVVMLNRQVSAKYKKLKTELLYNYFQYQMFVQQQQQQNVLLMSAGATIANSVPYMNQIGPSPKKTQGFTARVVIPLVPSFIPSTNHTFQPIPTVSNLDSSGWPGFERPVRPVPRETYSYGNINNQPPDSNFPRTSLPFSIQIATPNDSAKVGVMPSYQFPQRHEVLPPTYSGEHFQPMHSNNPQMGNQFMPTPMEDPLHQQNKSAYSGYSAAFPNQFQNRMDRGDNRAIPTRLTKQYQRFANVESMSVDVNYISYPLSSDPQNAPPYQQPPDPSTSRNLLRTDLRNKPYPYERK